MTVAEISRQVREGERTAVEVTQSALAEIERTDSDLHAFVRVMKDEALIQAEEVDSKKEKGSLAGVPVALKDNLCTKGLPTSCGSKSLEKYVPPYDAHVVEKLREAGAILIGKTNMDEFGMGSSTEFSSFGPTRNPVDPDHVPGGSSGGSAAAVASGPVPSASPGPLRERSVSNPRTAGSPGTVLSPSPRASTRWVRLPGRWMMHGGSSTSSPARTRGTRHRSIVRANRGKGIYPA